MLTAAGRRYISQAQRGIFAEEIRALKAEREIPGVSKLLPLRPVRDEEGVLKCDGRLRYAECLPRKTHCVRRLIVKHAHEQDHVGTNQVLAQLSVQYWIISARQAIREWERESMQCRKKKTSLAMQIIAPLSPVVKLCPLEQY